MRKATANGSARLRAVKGRLQQVGLICAGTVLERTKVCGRSYCACVSDPKARHGPYFEWNRWEDGALRHLVVSPVEARAIRRAQKNYQRVLKLLSAWEDESARAIVGAKRASRRGAER
jgi:hypothetical protein